MLGLLAGARRALADDHLTELRALIKELERVHATLRELSAPERAGLHCELLALLDEAASLVRSLGAEHARTRRRCAGSAPSAGQSAPTARRAGSEGRPRWT